jgi:hypothetical protein
MTAQALRSPARDISRADSPHNHRPVRDISGFAVFAHGEAGAAHAMAHRMLDTGRIEQGHRQLGEWLDGRSGCGSDWVHLHFHMAIFELARGDWNAAHTRFSREVLPVAAASEEALTDAPALLWRLVLAAPRSVELPWQPVRRTALIRMQRPSDPFVELHNLLALAGAGDAASIRHWLRTRPAVTPSRPERLVERMAVALEALAARWYQQAATVLQDVAPHLAQVGGSRAQNGLFAQLIDWSWQQASHTRPASIYAEAA